MHHFSVYVCNMSDNTGNDDCGGHMVVMWWSCGGIRVVLLS